MICELGKVKQSDKTGKNSLLACSFKLSKKNQVRTGHLHCPSILPICPIHHLRNVNSLVMYAFKGNFFIPSIVTIKCNG